MLFKKARILKKCPNTYLHFGSHVYLYVNNLGRLSQKVFRPVFVGRRKLPESFKSRSRNPFLKMASKIIQQQKPYLSDSTAGLRQLK